ncbi:MAG TPA: aminotransferase class I/II-fold pyridoxal phosphate-dependent enzyme [Phnomibacter sp.]|nr:aminotransferase class I/II-fold pyridoxal phosphate-dependent enzyme [Phnomibacter sp.]
MDTSYILNHLGEEHERYFNAIAPPIVQTSNFLFETVDDLRKAFDDEYGGFLYSRGLNPTVDILRRKLAALDGAEDCLVFNSGAAAIYASVMSVVNAGDHIVSVQAPYTWAHKLFTQTLPRYGVTHTYIDGTHVAHWEAAIRPDTRLFYLESPNSWTFELQDLQAVATLAKSRGIATIVDNSYCSPIYQQPIRLGIDMVLQSATKYISGHSDTVAGVLTGTHAHMKKIFNEELLTIGSGIQPFNAWLLLRGLRTLPMRLAHISNTTIKVVEWLKQHPLVEQVIFPFDPGHPQYDLAKRQMQGACGLVTFILKYDTVAAIEQFCNALKYIRMAVSWGGHESLIIPKVAGMQHDAFDARNPIHRSCRLYVGMEDASFLIGDMDKALNV